MTKYLNGKDLADFIKERQAKQVRNLRQEHKTIPKLAIIVTDPSPVISTYMRMKQHYGDDILIDTEVLETTMNEITSVIERCNEDPTVHGVIIQLPIADPEKTDEIVRLVQPEKDVDGLGSDKIYTPATALAINWLCGGYNIDLENKKIAIVGTGRLVGAPLAKLWRSSGYDVSAYDDTVRDLGAELRAADVIVTATGVPGLITSEMVQQKAVVIDAGTASEDGVIVGDVAVSVRERDDVTITPEKGGVGPLTVAALYDNVIQAARRSVKNEAI